MNHNLINQKFGRLTIIGETEPKIYNKIKNRIFLCQCDCGNTTTVNLVNLTNNHIKSCGCYRRECLSERMKKKVGKDNHVYKHGKSCIPLYKVFTSMKQRCNNPTRDIKRVGA